MIPYNDIKQDDPRLRPIPGFQDYYVDEEAGNIWSFKGTFPRILKPALIKQAGNYQTIQVSLRRDGESHVLIVKRLVMNVTDYSVRVINVDSNPWNVKKSNLELTPAGRRSPERINPETSTGFKYVYYNKTEKRYRPRITLPNGKYLWLKISDYRNIYEAAAVANIAISKQHGRRIFYNKVDGMILTL